MYPELVGDSFGSLRHFLLATPDPDEIDDRGCFSKRACDRIDNMLMLEMSRRMRGRYWAEEQQHGSDPNNRWRTASCLQKAVRFGDADMARFAASVGYDMDSKYVLRRLGVIAVEDVAAGDLFATLGVLAAMGNTQWRQSSDERRCLVFLADMLANGKKDRNLTDLLNAADFDEKTPKNDWVKLPSEDLLAIGTDPTKSWVTRSVAVWLAAGTKKYWGNAMPKGNDRDAAPVFKMMVDQGCTRAALYGAAKTASRLGEAFWVSFYLMDRQLQLTKTMTTIVDDLPPMPKCGKLLSASYDMHTREGKAALRRFQGIAAFKPFKDACPTWQAFMTILEEALFYVEGGVLHERVVFAGSEAVRTESWVNIMTRTGLPANMVDPLYAAVRENLPFLFQLREQVLWEKIHG